MLITTVVLFSTCALAIWPLPQNYTHGTTVLWLSPDVQIDYQLASSSPWYAFLLRTWNIRQAPVYSTGNQTNDGHPIVEAAIQRTKDTLFSENFVPWKFHPRNSDFEPAVNGSKTYIKTIALQQTQACNGLNSSLIDGGADESYSITVSEAGEATITAQSSASILWGLETLTQLFYTHSRRGEGVYTPLAPIKITDAPKFAHRGLNLDIARNYYEPADIKRTIDALAWNKFNRLHLHATDAQSWPLEIPTLPELAAKGAYRAGYSYSPDDLQDIQKYGLDRGVEVIIEIDMPGHTASVALSYPELITAFNVQPNWNNYSAEPPSGELKLNSTAVYMFLEKLFQDLLPRLKPYSGYFHSGGDEVNVNAYLLDETVRSNTSSVIQSLLQTFVDRVHRSIRAANLVPIVWEEMLLDWNLTLGNDVIIQTWRSDQAVADTVAKGYKTLAGNYNYWYLDCGHGQWLDSIPSSTLTPFPYLDYCSPLKNWRQIYSYNPLSLVPANATHLVLGAEVHLWSEQTDPVNLDPMLWPRAAAAGEVLWAGARDEQGRNRSQVEASPRLAEMRERMVLRGVRAGPVQMVFCTQNGTQCAL
ncbi:MAG: N-acetyl-glucosamine-6-phosphate deacetylase [Candelina mexicana]|nr:MAG: N-acetyl-glucosamine-6-phosphate deacetylase [Candelina mexicana]